MLPTRSVSTRKKRNAPSTPPPDAVFCTVHDSDDDHAVQPATSQEKRRRQTVVPAHPGDSEEVKGLRKQLNESRNRECRMGVRLGQAQKAIENCVDSELLRDVTVCDICKETIKQPCMTSCGHLFCEGCLYDWFETLLKKHRDNNPDYDPETVLPYTIPGHISRFPEYMQEALEEANRKSPLPYSCPLCRGEIIQRPSSAFLFKSVIQLVADKTEQGKDLAHSSDPALWDTFFGTS